MEYCCTNCSLQNKDFGKSNTVNRVQVVAAPPRLELLDVVMRLREQVSLLARFSMETDGSAQTETGVGVGESLILRIWFTV